MKRRKKQMFSRGAVEKSASVTIYNETLGLSMGSQGHVLMLITEYRVAGVNADS